MRIDGRLVVVTGASSGNGAATALAVARRGGRVALVARNEDRLGEVARQIVSLGQRATTHAVDLADAAAIARFAAEMVAAEGPPDILVNNAGAGRWLTVEETSPSDLFAMTAVPYFAAFNLTRALLPAMRQRRSGHIVNVTSVAARLIWPGAAAYTAARCAMLGFSESLRSELAGTGIVVTSAIFGTVATPYWLHNRGSEERLPRASQRMRPLTVKEVAQAMADAIERDAADIVRPGVFRVLFLADAIAPGITRRIMSRGWKPPSVL